MKNCEKVEMWNVKNSPKPCKKYLENKNSELKEIKNLSVTLTTFLNQLKIFIKT